MKKLRKIIIKMFWLVFSISMFLILGAAITKPLNNLIPYAYLGYAEMVEQLGKAGKGWNRVYTTFLVLGILIAFVAISNAEWINNSFKIHVGTEDYYEYIHQYNHNFENLRF